MPGYLLHEGTTVTRMPAGAAQPLHLPGEPANRPTIGCGLPRMVFEPNSDALAAATQGHVQGNLQQWIGDLIQVNAVAVENDDATLNVLVQYTVRRTQQQRTDQFTLGGQ